VGKYGIFYEMFKDLELPELAGIVKESDDQITRLEAGKIKPFRLIREAQLQLEIIHEQDLSTTKPLTTCNILTRRFVPV
jgi:hypothetical protein